VVILSEAKNLLVMPISNLQILLAFGSSERLEHERFSTSSWKNP